MNTIAGSTVELGRGEYTAFQLHGQVTIQASGFTPTSGYRVWLQLRPEDVFPPMYELTWMPPDGPTLPALAPFVAGTSFAAAVHVPRVTVLDADGAHEVNVELVGAEVDGGERTEMANHFSVVDGEIYVSYTEANVAGQPQLTYGRRAFMGSDVRVTATPIGKLVTVILETAADQKVRTFTLVVPPVRVPRGATAQVQVPGITADEFSGIAGPPVGQGIAYHIADLRGEAKRITS
ncbi:MAG TPA: hypothetical protein VJ802_18105 [Gemmatimonadaceae bacterium]|nr:hypothetical protein [Gemmatimonadaceae bacterium]